jgi:hypothetical protein
MHIDRLPFMTVEEIDIAFATKAYERFLSRMTINDKGCYIPRKRPRSDGYVRLSVTRGSTKSALGKVQGERTFYVHHLAWYVMGNKVPFSSQSSHVSHLCGDSRCFNVDHLAIEDPIENNSRKNCIASVKCPCPCQHVFWTCQHEPRCIPLSRLRPP